MRNGAVLGEVVMVADVAGGDAVGAAIVAITVIGGVVFLALLAWYIWLLVDIFGYPDPAWSAAGQSKQLWIILWVIGLASCVSIGLPVGLIYQFAIRPRVRQAADV